MKTSPLSVRQREILAIMREKSPDSRKTIFENALNNELTREDIIVLCQLINDEFLMNGIDEDYNPNQYGNELEELLDVINRPRLY